MKRFVKWITLSVLIFSLTACGSNNTAMTVNGEDVPLGEAVYLLREMETMFENQYGPTIWEVGQGGQTFNDIAKESAIESLTRLYVTKLEAEKRGITLEQADIDSVDALLEETLAPGIEGTLEEDGITTDDIRNVHLYDALGVKLMDVELVDFVVDETQLEASLAADPVYSQIQQYGYEGFLEQVTAQHILISIVNDDQSEKTDEEKAAALETATMVLELVQNGDDFDSLVERYSEDPGKATNNGYYTFSKGDMQIEFEEAAFNMEIDEVSGLVETLFGYHIIRKIDHIYPEEDQVQNVQEYENYIVEQYELMQKQAEFEVLFNVWVEDYEVVVNEAAWSDVKTTYEKALDETK